MNNIVILNALNLSAYAYQELHNGKNAVQYAADTADDMPEIEKKVLLIPRGVKASEAFSSFECFELESSEPSELVRALKSLSEGCDNIFYFSADYPLIDSALAKKMYANHLKYFCEYTFADGYPMGLSVEIVKTSILPMLASIAEDFTGKIGRSGLFSLIEKDINSFEIETEISPDDQRLLRVALYPDTKRNYQQLRLIAGEVFSQEDENSSRAGIILETVRKKGVFLRSLPIFFEFETTAGHPQVINYFPKSDAANDMELDAFRAALKKISDFSDDAVISLSIRNEPAQHSSPSGLAEAVLSFPGFELLIETSGIGWNREEMQKILGMDSGRVTWIIDLDACDRDMYFKLRGEGFDEAYAFTSEMVAASPSNVWVQAVRMKENEEDNEVFYKHWKEKTNNVIIQKYDWCCGRLDQRKVTDLSPVKRLPCWHLKREMAVLCDGRVPLCRDDLECEMILGNLFNDDIAEIWEAGRKYYQQHLDEEYRGLCRNCDEYYTYNY